MKFIWNAKSGEIHRLDADGRSLEACNLDQIETREEIEEDEALRLLADGSGDRCGHCWKEDED